MFRAAIDVGTECRDEFLATSNNWEHIRAHPELDSLIQRRDQVTTLWRSVLTDGVDEGSLCSIGTHAALWIIAGAVNNMIDERYAESEADDPPPTDTLIPILIDGLAPR